MRNLQEERRDLVKRAGRMLCLWLFSVAALAGFSGCGTTGQKEPVSYYIDAEDTERTKDDPAVEATEPVVRTRSLNQIIVRCGQTVSLELDGYFVSPSGGPVTYTLTQPEGNAIFTGRLDGSVLTVSGIAPGTAGIGVLADNGADRIWMNTILVTCVSVSDRAGYVLLAAAAAGILFFSVRERRGAR